jgi:thioredoxin reductase/Pyruvate/2-oxoacid:ferredoxin oxidoreductase delta subunit
MESLATYGIAALVTLFFFLLYWRKQKRMEQRAAEAAKKGSLYSEGPRSQHPHIDIGQCIGCGTCTSVCPEGDVLAMLGGKAVIVNGYKCIGHALCAEACPVGAITMAMSHASIGADMPRLTPEYETSIGGLYIVGELGGLALIKNAVNQGRDCVDTIGRRLAGIAGREQTGIYDVLIVGAGPAGISASLRAIENKLKYVTLEQDEVGGTVAKYPRQKLVMTSPVQFPMYGKFNKTELSKENLLAFWNMVLNRSDFNVVTGEKVDNIAKDETGVFTITTPNTQYRSRHVVLAMGRTGTPKKLGVKGEELPKVMYRLIEVDHYINKHILVVGGGDSAVEAAMGLSNQVGNTVTLSYRKEEFSRIKERNAIRITEHIAKKKVRVIFNSNPVEFKEKSVVLDVNGQKEEIPNDYAWVFAGGVPPNDFLRKIGVGFGMKDLTLEGSQEAKQAAASKSTP